MKAKEYLQQIKRAEYLINVKQREIDKLRSLIEYKSPNFENERITGGKTADRSELICKLVDLQQKIDKQIDELVDLKKKIMAELELLENPDFIKILYMRYFEFKTLEYIAVKMNYSYRWISKLHGQALLEFSKRVPISSY